MNSAHVHAARTRQTSGVWAEHGWAGRSVAGQFQEVLHVCSCARAHLTKRACVLPCGGCRHIGNSAATFTALALMERRHRGRWSAHYNGGNVPLAPYLPVLKVGAGCGLGVRFRGVG